MTKGKGGTWKIILIEIGVAVLAVLAKEIVDKTTEYISAKNSKAQQESDEKSESQEKSKNDSENGTS